MELLVVGVCALLAVAGAAALAPRLRVAAPLILVVLGIGVSFLPFVPPVEVDPEWILAGVLPPLLYSASVSMPAVEFRREFTAIRSLAVALVVISAVVVGVLFTWLIPGLDLWWGIALGAIVSPTDAVATSIVRQMGVSGRLASVLSGESLLNDATALVLLRSAIAGTAATMALRDVGLDFLYAVAVAGAIGWVVGRVNLVVRSRVADPTVNTILSFTVPFLASIPAEQLGASGLVAAVVAGLVTGHGAPRWLPPQHRLSDVQNWRAVELVLEGGIFLVMGLELAAIVDDVRIEHTGIGPAIVVAVVALVVLLAVRAAFVSSLLFGLRRASRRRRRDSNSRAGPRHGDPGGFVSSPLGWRDGTVIVWAGMRGAVTVAAAQTLPSDAPSRPTLLLIAFVVAACSLVVQGSTLPAVVRRVHPDAIGDRADPRERAELAGVLDEVRATVLAGLDPAERSLVELRSRALAASDPVVDQHLLAVVHAQRDAVLDARDAGSFGPDLLEAALVELDSAQVRIERRRALGPGDDPGDESGRSS